MCVGVGDDTRTAAPVRAGSRLTGGGFCIGGASLFSLHPIASCAGREAAYADLYVRLAEVWASALDDSDRGRGGGGRMLAMGGRGSIEAFPRRVGEKRAAGGGGGLKQRTAGEGEEAGGASRGATRGQRREGGRGADRGGWQGQEGRGGSASMGKGRGVCRHGEKGGAAGAPCSL